MSSYDDIFSLRYNELWLQQRTEVSMVKAANYILLEPATIEDHEHRVAWARWAVRNSMMAANSFRWPVAMDPTVIAERRAITDEKIDAVVAAVIPQVVADFASGTMEGGPMMATMMPTVPR